MEATKITWQLAFDQMAFANAEYLGATGRADVLSRRPTILHGYDLGILHFPLGFTLNTVRLHHDSPFTTYLRSRVNTTSRFCSHLAI